MWLKALQENSGPCDGNLFVRMEELFISECFLALSLDVLLLTLTLICFCPISVSWIRDDFYKTPCYWDTHYYNGM